MTYGTGRFLKPQKEKNGIMSELRIAIYEDTTKSTRRQRVGGSRALTGRALTAAMCTGHSHETERRTAAHGEDR